MEKLPITIENSEVTINPTPEGVWLTEHEIARLFGVFVSAVSANIRSIFKNEILHEGKVCRRRNFEDGGFVDTYNLEMITALAFRLKSQEAEWLRQWIMQWATNPVIVWKVPDNDSMLN